MNLKIIHFIIHRMRLTFESKASSQLWIEMAYSPVLHTCTAILWVGVCKSSQQTAGSWTDKNTNQIWSERICISSGIGLDLEVISYEPVLCRERCNVSLSSAFNRKQSSRWRAAHPRRLCVNREESQTPQDGIEPGWSLIPSPPSTDEEDPWEKSAFDTDTNSSAKACIRVRLAKITLSAWSPGAPHAGLTGKQSYTSLTPWHISS